MLRKLNRIIQDYMRPKRLAFGRWMWDRKNKVQIDEEALKGRGLIEYKVVKSILFLRYDGKIGDMIINTFMFREIKKQYPHVKIGVVTRGAAREVIKNNPYVDEIYDYDKSSSMVKALAGEIAEKRYDLLIDFSEMLRVKQMMFINLCRAKINMGINKEEWNLFDINLNYSLTERHITHRYEQVLNLLGIEEVDTSYDIHLTMEEDDRGRVFRNSIPEKRLVTINPYGASKYRTFNREKIIEISQLFLQNKDTGLTFVFPPEKKEEIRKICDTLGKRVYFNENLKSILDTAGVLKYSDLIITPDTSIVHLGVAFDREMVAVYRSDEGSEENNSLVWGPGSERVKQIFSLEGRAPGEEVDINNFDVGELLRQD